MPRAVPHVTPVPTRTPAWGVKSVRVTSIPALLTTLADNTVDEIVVADGTYQVSPSNEKQANSLWIGGDHVAARTRPITVRAETVGGVTFSGSGTIGAYGGLSFEDGAHDQTWDGFRFADMTAEYTGIIVGGGYTPGRTPFGITLRNMIVTGSCTGRATTANGQTWDHAVYLAHAVGAGPHDIFIDNLSVDGSGDLASAIHVYHGDAAAPGSWNVTIRGLHVTGTQSAVILAVDGLHDLTIDGADIDGAKAYGVSFESTNATSIVLKNMTTTNSGYGGFHSSMGTNPAGVTLTDNSFN